MKGPEEKREEHKGGVAPWLRGGQGAPLPAGPEIAVRTPGAGLAARLHALLNSKPALFLSLAGAAAVSWHGLGFGQRGDRMEVLESSAGPALPARSAALFAPPDRLPIPAAEAISSLALAQRANKGVLPDPAETALAPAPGPAAAPASPARPESEAAPKDEGRAPPRMVRSGYGRLSSGMPGLAGGGGLAGGIGQNFQQMKLSNRAPRQGEALSPGGDAALVRSKMPARAQVRSTLRGENARRLEGMNRAMASARGQGGAQALSALHAREWSNSAGSGHAITGQGASPGVIGETSFSEEEGIGPGQPLEALPDSPPAADIPALPSGDNATPYQGMVNLARIMLMAAAGLLLLSFALGTAAKIAGPAAPAYYAWAERTAVMAMIAAALVTAMGVAVVAYGQATQGLVFTGIGALLTYLSYTAAKGNASASKASELSRQKASEIGSSVPLPKP